MAQPRHNHSRRGVESDRTTNDVQKNRARNRGDDDDHGEGPEPGRHLDDHRNGGEDGDTGRNNHAAGNENNNDDNDHDHDADPALKQLLRRLRREHITNFGGSRAVAGFDSSNRDGSNGDGAAGRGSGDSRNLTPDKRRARYLLEAAAGNVGLAAALYWEDYLAEHQEGDNENNEWEQALRHGMAASGAGDRDRESDNADGGINLMDRSASAKATKKRGKLKGDRNNSANNYGEDVTDAKQPTASKTKKKSSLPASSSSSSPSSSSSTSSGGGDEDSQKPPSKNVARTAMAKTSGRRTESKDNHANCNNNNQNVNQENSQQQQANMQAEVSALLSALSNNNNDASNHMQNNYSSEQARMLAEYLLSGVTAGSISNHDYNTVMNTLLSQLTGMRDGNAGGNGNSYSADDVVSTILASLNMNSNADASIAGAAAAASGYGSGNGNVHSHGSDDSRASLHYGPAGASAMESNDANIWRPNHPADNDAASAAAGAYAEQQHVLRQLQQQFNEYFGGSDNSAASNGHFDYAAGGRVNANPAAATVAAAGRNIHGIHDSSAATAMEAAMQLRFNFALQQQQQQQQVQSNNPWHQLLGNGRQAIAESFEHLARAYAAEGRQLTEEEANIIIAALAQGANIRQIGELGTAAAAAYAGTRCRSNEEENQNQGDRPMKQTAASNNNSNENDNSSGNNNDRPANNRNREESNHPQQRASRGEESQQRMRRIQHGMIRQHNMEYRDSDSDSMEEANRDRNFDDVAPGADVALVHRRLPLNHEAFNREIQMRGGAAVAAAARRDSAGGGVNNRDLNAQVAGDSASISEDEGGLLSMVRRGSSFLENRDNQDGSRKRARLDDHNNFKRKVLGDDISDDGSDSLDGEESVDLKDFFSDDDEEVEEENGNSLPSNSRGKASRVIWGLSTNESSDDEGDEDTTTAVCIPKSWLQSGFSLSDCGNGLKVSDPEDDLWDQISRSHSTFLRDSPLKGIKGLFPFNCKGVSAMLSLVTAMLYSGVTVQGSIVHCQSDRTPFDELTKAQRRREFETRLVDALSALVFIAAQSSAKRCADALTKMDQRMARRRKKHWLSAEEEDAYLKKRNSLLKRCRLCRVCWWEIDAANNNVTIYPKNRDPKDIVLMRSYTNILDIKCYVKTHLRSFTEPGGCALLLETLIHCHGRRRIEKLLSTLEDSRPAKKVNHLFECSCKRALAFLDRKNSSGDIVAMPDEHDCIPPELLSLIITGEMHSDLESWSADMLGIGLLRTDNKIRVGQQLSRPVNPVWFCHGDIGYSVLFLEKKEFLGSEKVLDEDCRTFRLAHWNCWSGERTSMKVITSIYDHEPYSKNSGMGIISDDSDPDEKQSKKSCFRFKQGEKTSWEKKWSPAWIPITDEELASVKPHPEDVIFYPKQFHRWRFSFASPQDLNLEANNDIWIPFYRLHGRKRLVVEMKLSPRICVLVRNRWPLAVISDFIPDGKVPVV